MILTKEQAQTVRNVISELEKASGFLDTCFVDGIRIECEGRTVMVWDGYLRETYFGLESFAKAYGLEG